MNINHQIRYQPIFIAIYVYNYINHISAISQPPPSSTITVRHISGPSRAGAQLPLRCPANRRGSALPMAISIQARGLGGNVANDPVEWSTRDN